MQPPHDPLAAGQARDSTSRGLSAAAGTRTGRREIRTIKVVTIAAGIVFPHAAQAIQLVRRRRPASGRGRWHTETVYAITDLPSQNLSQLWTGRDRVRHARSDQMIGGSTDRG
jgi:hypothetical protein